MPRQKEAEKLSDYILRSREERTHHVDLISPCKSEEVGNAARQRRGRKALLRQLGLDNDIENWQKAGINTCHLCNNGTHSEEVCSNPLHIYFGTAKENAGDVPPEARKAAGKAGGKASAALKNEEGKSVNASKGGKTTHSVKTRDGKSAAGVKNGKKAKELGVGVHDLERRKAEGWSVKAGQSTSSQLWVSLHDGLVSTASNVTTHNKSVGASPKARVQLDEEQVKQYIPRLESFIFCKHKPDGYTRKCSGRRVPLTVLETLRDRGIVVQMN